MPCWQKQESTVSLNSPDLGLLTAALRELGFRINPTGYRGFSLSADHFNGPLVGSSVVVRQDGSVGFIHSDSSVDVTPMVNQVKRAYSVEVIKSSSKQFRWDLKQKSETQFVTTRRF